MGFLDEFLEEPLEESKESLEFMEDFVENFLDMPWRNPQREPLDEFQEGTSVGISRRSPWRTLQKRFREKSPEGIAGIPEGIAGIPGNYQWNLKRIFRILKEIPRRIFR